MSDDRIRVAVIFGGRNGEHPVSCASAAGIFTHLDRRRFTALPIRINQSGRWTVGTGNPVEHADGGAVTGAVLDAVVPPCDGPAGIAEVTASLLSALAVLRQVDVIFPALHGPFGEDGTLQSCLAATGVPVVGNGPLASALGMDKIRTKKLLAAEGMTVADSVVVGYGTAVDPDRIVERLGLPLFVKPCRSGSSLGVTRVEDAAALTEAVAAARLEDPAAVLIEAAVPGREIDIGVLERPDGTLVASPPLEIHVAGKGVFDFHAKYGDADTVFDLPAPLDPPTTNRMAEHALTAFTALGCRGLVRVDFFLRPDNTLVFNEVNTFPGFTAASQYPRMFAAAGLPYPRLLDTLLDTAIAQPARPVHTPPAMTNGGTTVPRPRQPRHTHEPDVIHHT